MFRTFDSLLRFGSYLLPFAVRGIVAVMLNDVRLSLSFRSWGACAHEEKFALRRCPKTVQIWVPKNGLDFGCQSVETYGWCVFFSITCVYVHLKFDIVACHVWQG